MATGVDGGPPERSDIYMGKLRTTRVGVGCRSSECCYSYRGRLRATRVDLIAGGVG